MSEQPASPLRFLGIPGYQIGAQFRTLKIGEVVTIDYAGGSYQARITARHDDYDDYGNEVSRYDLEVTAPDDKPG